MIDINLLKTNVNKQNQSNRACYLPAL